MGKPLKSGFCICVMFFGLIFLSSASVLQLQQESRRAMNALYHFRFADADSIVSSMETDFPDVYMPHLMRSHYFWWKLISQQADEATRQSYLKSLSRAHKASESMANSPQSTHADVFQFINLYALRARLDLLNGDYVKAIRHMKQCVDFLKESLGNEEEFPDFYLTSGLYNYMTAYGSKRYPFLLVYVLMYPRGDMIMGKAQLQIAARSADPVIRTEARYFLMKILHELEQDYGAALVYASWLTSQYPGNLIFLYHQMEILRAMGYEQQASLLNEDFMHHLRSNKQLSREQISYLKNLL